MDEKQPDSEAEKEEVFDYIEKNITYCSIDQRRTILCKIIETIGTGRIQISADSSNIYMDDMPLALLKELKAMIEKMNEDDRIDFSEIGL